MANGPVGYTQPGGGAFVPQSTSSSKKKKGLDLGGLLSSLMGAGSRRKLEDIYRENLEYQKMIMDEAYGRSLPKGVTGPGGMVSFDKDTEEMLMELDPAVQRIMDAWLSQGARAGEELAEFDMDARTMDQIRMFDEANEFRDRQDRNRLAEQNEARGVGGTQQFYAEMSLGEQVNQRRLQEALQSRGMSMNERQMLSGEMIAMGNAGIDAPRMLMQQADLSRAIGQGSHTGVNASGVALGSLALADTKAGFYSGMLGTASQYGGSDNSGSSSGGGMFGGFNPFSLFT
tara:strand:- start:6179 stop:7039 length:861 start_codon:yes stop_codon:yes gene_type:complete